MVPIINLIILTLCVLPKINIITIPGNSTGIRLEDILILLSFYIYFKKSHMNINLSDKMKKVIAIFYLYIFVTALSTAIGCYRGWIRPISGILFIIRKVEYFMFIFLGYYYWKNKNDVDYKKFFNIVIIINFIISILQMFGIVGSFNAGVMLDGLTQGRISSVFNGAYEYSAFLLMLLPIYLYEIIFEKKYQDCIWVAFILFGILVSKSRSSLLIAALIILLMLINMKYKRKLYKNQIILLFCAIIMATIGINFINLDRFEQLDINSVVNVCRIAFKSGDFDNYIQSGMSDWYGKAEYDIIEIAEMNMDASLYLRMTHWMQMIDGLKYSPLIGVGASISASAADGNYVRILCESGLLGLAIWIYMLIIIFTDLKKDKFHIIVKMMLISIILGSIMIDLFEASRIMMLFWFILGIMYSNEVYKNEKQD